MKRPFLRATIFGAKARTMLAVPFKLLSMTSGQSKSSGIDWKQEGSGAAKKIRFVTFANLADELNVKGGRSSSSVGHEIRKPQ